MILYRKHTRKVTFENFSQMDEVRILNAAHNELVALPLDIGDQSTFAHLEYLDVSHNRLHSLPPSLGNMVSLTHIDSSYNNLKRVPPEVSYCTNLTLLHLKANIIKSQLCSDCI